MLKPQDVVLCCKILAKANQPWTQPSIAAELVISASEVNAGIKRLKQCGLLEQKTSGALWTVVKPAFREFLLHGIAYVFPLQKLEPSTGLPTQSAHPLLNQHFNFNLDFMPVWPDETQKYAGFAVKPLYPTLVKAALNDESFYEYMVLIDCLRDHSFTERDVAKLLLKEKLAGKKLTKLVKKSKQAPELTLPDDEQLDLLSL